MEVELVYNGKVYKVGVSSPTLARKDKVRALTKELLSEAKRLDELMPVEKVANDPVQLVAKSCESERLQDLYLIKIFKAIAINVPKELSEQFDSDEQSEFWQSQNLQSLQEAFNFFRGENTRTG